MQRRLFRLLSILASAAMLALAGKAAPGESSDCSAVLSAADAEAIRGVIEAYRTSWLRGDEKGVLETFAPDAVLLPAHGAPAVVGIAAIRSYWFPPGAPATTITTLDITTEGLGGDGRTAYVHGRDDVAWTTIENGVAKKYGHPGTYLNVMTKAPDGSWKIARHMWDDGRGQS